MQVSKECNESYKVVSEQTPFSEVMERYAIIAAINHREKSDIDNIYNGNEEEED